MNKQKILEQLYNSNFSEEVLARITSNNHLKEDLRQEVFLILFEMHSNKILSAYKKGYLNFLFIRIVKNQYHSSSSPFHKYFRDYTDEYTDYEYEENTIDEIKIENLINDLQNFYETLPMVDCELFKMYYKLEDYNNDNGKNRDLNCKSDKSSFIKLERRLTIETLNGKNLKISRYYIRNSIIETTEKLIDYIKEKENYDFI